jgi:DNA-directed RNA polymerase subunit alpha
MSILAFQKPNRVIMIDGGEFMGRFEFTPLEPGFGITIGNALRRVLLSSLQGYAITQIKISGVVHEFDTIPGVIDDVTNIILNLKEVRFSHIKGTSEDEALTINISGREVFKAGDLNANLSCFEVLNPDAVICRMDRSATFNLELKIEKGRGYLPSDENRNLSKDIGIIGVDAIFTPIRNVMYSVEPERIEQKTDYDRLILEIETDGSISPKDALRDAAKILIQHFALFSDEKFAVDEEVVHTLSDNIDDNHVQIRQLLKSSLSDLDLSVRAINCLNSAEVHTLGDLCKIPRSELLKFRNFGKKSLTELEEKLDSLHLSFGMDLTKYKLDLDNE